METIAAYKEKFNQNLETERLILSLWQASNEDAEALYEYAKDHAVGPPAGWKPHESKEESLAIIKSIFLNDLTYKIQEKSTGKIIGSISLFYDRRRDGVSSMEVGYALAHESWGKGYMAEACIRIIDFAFRDLNLEVVAIQTRPNNKRSQRVIEKLGFKYEGLLRKAYRTFEGIDRDCLVYSILKEEWFHREEKA